MERGRSFDGRGLVVVFAHASHGSECSIDDANDVGNADLRRRYRQPKPAFGSSAGHDDTRGIELPQDLLEVRKRDLIAVADLLALAPVFRFGEGKHREAGVFAGDREFHASMVTLLTVFVNN